MGADSTGDENQGTQWTDAGEKTTQWQDPGEKTTSVVPDDDVADGHWPDPGQESVESVPLWPKDF
jgi:hypothetical protein